VSTFRFVDGAEFDSTTGEIRRAGHVVRLEPQPARVLAALAARAGELVTHDEVRRAVWGETTHVKIHDALHYCIRQIRAALGDGGRQPRYIETIPRRGYRMRAEAIAPAARPSRVSASVPRRWALRVALAALVATSVVAWDRGPNNHHQIAVKVVKTLHDLVF
jgi:DNA-binding winged helix-turn-helix (wHTH) protein